MSLELFPISLKNPGLIQKFFAKKLKKKKKLRYVETFIFHQFSISKTSIWKKNPLPPISLSDNFKQTFFKGWPHKILISLTEYLPILFGKIYYIPMLRLMAIYIMSKFLLAYFKILWTLYLTFPHLQNVSKKLFTVEKTWVKDAFLKS